MQSLGMDSVPSCPNARFAIRIHGSEQEMPNCPSPTGYGQLNPAGIVNRVIGSEPPV